MFRELGLGPLWRLRQQPVVALAAAPVDEAGTTPEPARVPDDARAAAIARMDWPELLEAIRDCRACGLCDARKQAVPGVGDVDADWLFVGEGPGAEEDERGEPFVGQAGKLLDAMLAAIGLRRGEGVYIANTVKCRPPGNRTPEAAETSACWPFLRRQIELVRPRMIVALGRPAAQILLNTEVKIAAARGRQFEYQGIPVIVTYHPAYLLRNLPDKAKAWEDLCFMRRLMAD
jgi:DNA polymerase